MAFVTTQTAVNYLDGPGGYTLISGTYLSSSGGTGGIIAAGYTNASGTLTAVSAPAPGLNTGIGGRKIISCILTPTLSDATAPGGAISYNTTLDADVFTCVTTADTGGLYTLICKDRGA